MLGVYTTLSDTTAVSCSDLQQFLHSEKIIFISQCAVDKTIVVSDAGKKIIDHLTVCPKGGAEKYEPFYVQSNDSLKCRLGYRASCKFINPPLPSDPPGF